MLGKWDQAEAIEAVAKRYSSDCTVYACHVGARLVVIFGMAGLYHARSYADHYYDGSPLKTHRLIAVSLGNSSPVFEEVLSTYMQMVAEDLRRDAFSA